VSSETTLGGTLHKVWLSSIIIYCLIMSSIETMWGC